MLPTFFKFYFFSFPIVVIIVGIIYTFWTKLYKKISPDTNIFNLYEIFDEDDTLTILLASILWPIAISMFIIYLIMSGFILFVTKMIHNFK